MYFNMDVCHKYIPVFFSGAASIGCITYHAFMFVKTFGKSRTLDLFRPPETFSPVTFIVTEVTNDINR